MTLKKCVCTNAQITNTASRKTAARFLGAVSTSTSQRLINFATRNRESMRRLALSQPKRWDSEQEIVAQQLILRSLSREASCVIHTRHGCLNHVFLQGLQRNIYFLNGSSTSESQNLKILGSPPRRFCQGCSIPPSSGCAKLAATHRICSAGILSLKISYSSCPASLCCLGCSCLLSLTPPESIAEEVYTAVQQMMTTCLQSLK